MVLGSVTLAAFLPIRSIPHHLLKFWFFAYRIMEYPELKGIHKDHRVLAPYRTTQKCDRVSESVVQMLLELQQVQCHDCFLGSLHGDGVHECGCTDCVKWSPTSCK